MFFCNYKTENAVNILSLQVVPHFYEQSESKPIALLINNDKEISKYTMIVYFQN